MIATCITRVVETVGFEPRQHRHLGARLDLEDADRIGALEHLVVGRSSAGCCRARAAAGQGSAAHAARTHRAEATASPGQQVDFESARGRRDRPCPTARSCGRASSPTRPRTSTSGERVITMPPLWIPIWPGKPSTRRQIASISAPSSPPTGPRTCRPDRRRAVVGEVETRRVARPGVAAGTSSPVRARCSNRQIEVAPALVTESGSGAGATCSAPTAPASDSRASYSRTICSTDRASGERLAHIANRRTRPVGITSAAIAHARGRRARTRTESPSRVLMRRSRCRCRAPRRALRSGSARRATARDRIDRRDPSA